MIKAILILPNISRAQSSNKVGDFYWNEEHQAYIWQGRELSIDEFNQNAAKVINSNKDKFYSSVVPKIIEPAPETAPLPPIEKKRRNLARARAIQASKSLQTA